MRKAVFRGFVLIALMVLIISIGIFSYFFMLFSVRETEKELLRTLSIIDYTLDYEGDLQAQTAALSPEVLEGTGRITIIDLLGNVAADTSEKADLEENHMNRAEIKQALDTGEGLSIRRSQTLGQELMYAAVLADGGNHILRLAVPYNGRTVFLGTLLAVILAGAAVSAAAAYFAAKGISYGITKPLSDICKELSKVKAGDEKLSFKPCKYDEINGIITAVGLMSGRMEGSLFNLRSEKAKVEYILDNISDGIIFADGEGRVLNINKAALNMLGCSKGAGENIVMYTTDVNIWDGVEKALKNGTDSSFDIKCHDGKTAFVHIKRTEAEGKTAASILLTDVTALRESERMRSEFFSNASHELKTPLTSIRGYSELLGSDMSFSDSQKKTFANIIKKETENMSALINDILMISRLESGEAGGEKTEINLGALVNEILEAEKPAVSEKNLKIITECNEAFVYGEYRYYYQLLLNLIDNSIKYNKPGGEVYVKIFKDRSLSIEVSDTGIGISAYDRQRVFERFYRADNGRDKNTEGTGLGLAIVKHIVNYLGGTITMESEPGEGTSIKIIL